MKKFNVILLIGVAVILSSCGGASMTDNTYLGQLPSISKKYQDLQDEYKEKGKKATDMNDAFKYDKEYKLAKDEGKKAVEEYLNTYKFDTPLMFDANPDYLFEISDFKVKGASYTRVNLVLNATMKEDIKNKYGGFEKYIFAYIKALDAEGNLIGKPTVMSTPLGGKHPKFEKGVVVEMSGGIGNLREFENFDRIVFISKEEYKELK